MAVSKTTSSATETTARHLWLAGLGVLAVARREAAAGARRALADVDVARQRAQRNAADAQARLVAGLDKARGQVEPTVARLGAEVEARLLPVLEKLGLKPAAPHRARKAATKRPVRRPAVARTPATRTVRRTR